VGFSASSEGSEGVLFIQFEDKSVVAVKGSSTVAADMFALELGLITSTRVPKYRVVRSGVDDEFEVMSKKLNELDENNHPLHRNKHGKLLERSVLTIMEFIAKGKALCDIQSSSLFGENDLTKEGALVLMETARMTVFDMVINNWDRIPLIWDNTGNPDNILFTKYKTRHVHPVAIDSTVTSIDPAMFDDSFLEYLDKVRYIVNEICQGAGVPEVFEGVRDSFEITASEKKPSLDNFSEFFKSTTECDIINSEMGGFQAILAGLIEGIVAFSKVTKENLEKIRDSVERRITEGLPEKGMTADSLALYKVNIDFLESVVDLMRQAAPVLEPELEKLKLDCFSHTAPPK